MAVDIRIHHCIASRLGRKLVLLVGRALLGLQIAVGDDTSAGSARRPPIAFLRTRFWGRRLVEVVVGSAMVIHFIGAFGDPFWNGRAEIDTHPERLWSWSYAPFVAPFRECPWEQSPELGLP